MNDAIQESSHENRFATMEASGSGNYSLLNYSSLNTRKLKKKNRNTASHGKIPNRASVTSAKRSSMAKPALF